LAQTLPGGGVVANIRDTEREGEITKRVELFAEARKIVYGILHTFYVAYSSEVALLRLAESPTNVVQVRTLSPDTATRLIQDRLILRRTQIEEERQTFSYRTINPSIFVPAAWRERVNLKTGDQVVISPDTVEYALPPPTI